MKGGRNMGYYINKRNRQEPNFLRSSKEFNYNPTPGFYKSIPRVLLDNPLDFSGLLKVISARLHPFFPRRFKRGVK